MKFLKVVLPIAFCLFSAGALVTEAKADHYDRYRSARYAPGRNPEEIRLRSTLRNRLLDLADRVRLAERNGNISRRDADSMWRTLDYVHDFLRNDRFITRSEFERRMRDMDNVEHDLRSKSRRGPARYDRYDRYDDRYDRYDDRRR